jgi:hypothetical protein
MCQEENKVKLTAEQIIQNFLDREVDPIEIERVQNDMLVHYCVQQTTGTLRGNMSGKRWNAAKL